MKRVRKSLCRRLISGISAFVMALTMMTFALPQSVFAATTDDIGSINVKFNWVHTGVPETGEAHNLGGGEVVIEYFTGEHTWGNKPVTKQATTFGYNQSSIDIDLRNGYDYITVDVCFSRKGKEHLNYFNEPIDYKNTEICKYVEDVIGISEFTCYYTEFFKDDEDDDELYFKRYSFIPKKIEQRIRQF